MANFKTHVSVAALASLAAAGVAVKMQLISYDQTLWLVFLGMVGGLLPDIDAGNSRPVRLLFNVLALLAVSATAELLQHRHDSYWVLSGAAVAYVTVRYGLFALFNHFTEHRGVFHSLLAAVFFALLASCISYYFLHWTVMQAWLNGLFIAFGFIVHLLLDELYSVDLKNKRMKKSFGTALKLCHYQNLTASLSLLALTMVLAWFAPSTLPVRQAIGLLHWHVIK
ncbi:MAG: metal-dependent hydrolase [Methylovulum sp.]|uniref:metal-dependent hydrolase n=1 Tax=Methylovulum sp. TaxID=1916980 RepID=UPI0026225A95|nr:metal-dependent hydrolase [Methylovulum sp.]MDD2722594.1 metal-dependent hydrolase [Methylovulum sp.]MDD5123122.1 metal-dependent hydrolase [Methylovulum sp.]